MFLFRQGHIERRYIIFFQTKMHTHQLIINKNCQEIISKTNEVHINPNYITRYLVSFITINYQSGSRYYLHKYEILGYLEQNSETDIKFTIEM